jgi:hypothetical protein
MRASLQGPPGGEPRRRSAGWQNTGRTIRGPWKSSVARRSEDAQVASLNAVSDHLCDSTRGERSRLPSVRKSTLEDVFPRLPVSRNHSRRPAAASGMARTRHSGCRSIREWQPSGGRRSGAIGCGESCASRRLRGWRARTSIATGGHSRWGGPCRSRAPKHDQCRNLSRCGVNSRSFHACRRRHHQVEKSPSGGPGSLNSGRAAENYWRRPRRLASRAVRAA